MMMMKKLANISSFENLMSGGSDSCCFNEDASDLCGANAGYIDATTDYNPIFRKAAADDWMAINQFVNRILDIERAIKSGRISQKQGMAMLKKMRINTSQARAILETFFGNG